jgi:hypothetical protein
VCGAGVRESPRQNLKALEGTGLNQNFLIRVCTSGSSVLAINVRFLLPVKVFSPESHQVVIGGVEINSQKCLPFGNWEAQFRSDLY